MPKLYEYFGLIILFYSNEHLPVHVHGKYQDEECKAEIVFVNGLFMEIIIKDVKGKKPLNNRHLKMFKQLVELYREDILQKWIDYFVYNKEVISETITKKI